MSHIQSHHGGAEGAHNTYLVILKVYGSAIQLWSRDRMALVDKSHLFRISCHNVETHAEDLASDIQVFMLNEPAAILDKCSFQDQHSHGQVIQAGDLAIFMTGPVPSTRKASYTIDLALANSNSTSEDLAAAGETTDSFERIGRTYLYLDPEFSSQGIQRTPILADQTHKPIGQVQVEYLIVTNPVGYGQPAPRPDWLFCENNLDAGHRGAGSGRRDDLPGALLENTIDSFNYAHRNGADMCELDVLITADGIPIVYHDFDVDAVAAQQSSNELGKFRVQVNQFTYKQLRDFRLLALHDGEGCPYTLNVPNQAETNRPFPTLADVLDQVDKTCGLNIEIKWPQMLENGQMEAKRFREINDFVDRIIRVAEEHAGDRRIILESFDADLVIMLRLKQNTFPVVFLSQAMTDRYKRYDDMRARSVWNGIYFAQAFDLAGIDLIADYYLTLGKKLVDFIKDHNLVARAWGHMGDTKEILEALKALNLQCVTYDRIDQMKQLRAA